MRGLLCTHCVLILKCVGVLSCKITSAKFCQEDFFLSSFALFVLSVKHLDAEKQQQFCSSLAMLSGCLRPQVQSILTTPVLQNSLQVKTSACF